VDENLTFFIFLSGPSAPPWNLTLNDTTSTSLLVSWSEVPAADKNGIIRSYTVGYQANDSRVENRTVVFVPNREVNLTGLLKSMNYSVRVLASTIKGDGNYSDPEFFVTNQDGELEFRFPRFFLVIIIHLKLRCSEKV